MEFSINIYENSWFEFDNIINKKFCLFSFFLQKKNSNISRFTISLNLLSKGLTWVYIFRGPRNRFSVVLSLGKILQKPYFMYITKNNIVLHFSFLSLYVEKWKQPLLIFIKHKPLISGFATPVYYFEYILELLLFQFIVLTKIQCTLKVVVLQSNIISIQMQIL